MERVMVTREELEEIRGMEIMLLEQRIAALEKVVMAQAAVLLGPPEEPKPKARIGYLP